jgi:hypothetical protein
MKTPSFCDRIIRPGLLTAVLLTAGLPAAVFARDAVLSKNPIPLRVGVGKEAIISFPQPATHTRITNETAANAVSNMLTPQGVMYLTATKPFERSRMIAELVDGQMVMIDIEASENGPFDTELNITDRGATNAATAAAAIPAVATTPALLPAGSGPTGSAIAPQPAAQPSPGRDGDDNPYKPDFLKDGAAKTLNMAEGDLGGAQVVNAGSDYHQMVRYGFRHYVGPARLIGDDLGKPVKVGKSDVASSLLRMNDGRLSVKPLKQWAIGDSYLTVLLVNNRSASAVEFDPRGIRGRWMFAAALYPVLEPRGSRFDQTLWALISAEPFDQARR